MGATLDLFLEYDDSTDAEPFIGDIDGIIDFTKSRNIVYCKPYSFMQAVAGVRGSSDIKPRIIPRGFPKHMNDQVNKYLDQYYGLDYQCAGWLFYSELIECLEHAKIKKNELETSIQIFIKIFELLKDKYGEKRARMVFAIGSP